ncbi:5-deoxy-glucuronate isomerase [Planctomonas sp. JC2975]|uniref:5-deoxy-glucuronate isomerase n=1 Tax=Planctomonas sp. JC2975 TaxID=2729626 RepID=UPI001473684B|nr:5-deoxy-glucuronate isomerase [Planctomonas sp. JC2975]NNC11559.1 5-deoxy-glucuronate isomerase [Planctomonas sp. JC2975]
MVVRNEWFFPAGSLRRGEWESVVDDGIAGWRHTGIRIAVLDDGAVGLPAADVERIVVPLAGGFRVGHDDTTTVLHGRASVFDGATDVLYVGAGRALTISGSGRVAVAEAVTSERKPSAYLAKSDVPVEIRGAGRDTRRVHNFGTPDALDAAAVIACEVITPSGNWSSHPAHKHDEAVDGHESQLEEIYYFESATRAGADAPQDADAFGTFAAYSSPAGEIDTSAMVRTGDIALVPFGFHGPAAAAPEYDLYYLNVMAGPGELREWLISDDPRQSWIRDEWARTPQDPRLTESADGRRGPQRDDAERDDDGAHR